MFQRGSLTNRGVVAELEQAWSQAMSSARLRAAMIVGRVAGGLFFAIWLTIVIGSAAGMSGRLFRTLIPACLVLTIVNVLIGWTVVLAAERYVRNLPGGPRKRFSPARSSMLARMYYRELVGDRWWPRRRR
jgi:hypothetical protein